MAYEWFILVENKGIQVPKKKKFAHLKATAEDLEFLERLREEYWDTRPDLVPVKEIVKSGKYKNLHAMLRRLWYSGYITKYAKVLHTQSDRVNYTSFDIWHDKQDAEVPDGPQFFYDGGVDG